MKIVGLGGSVTPASATGMALREALRPAEESGADVQLFGGEYLSSLPHYRGAAHAPGDGTELIEAVRQADGVLPGTWLSRDRIRPGQECARLFRGSGRRRATLS